MNAEYRVAKLIGPLPEPPAPIALFEPIIQNGNTLYLSGQGPIVDGKPKYTGKIGQDCSTEMGIDAARICGINLLAHLKRFLNTLDAVEQILNIKVYVASSPDYYDQPIIANGVSDLMVQVFGDRGRHSRCALGLQSLPGNIPVEVEMTLQVKQDVSLVDVAGDNI